MELAELSLANDTQLDLERPFVDKPRGRNSTHEKFLQLCGDGEKRACWIAAQLSDADVGDAYRSVAANCRGGDIMSCRALPASYTSWLYRDEPGALSRRVDCQRNGAAPCDLVALRRECVEGFPNACLELAATTGTTDIESLLARELELAVSGCAAGIAGECLLAAVRSYPLVEGRRLCDLTDQCGELSIYYVEAHDPSRARDALERHCEFRKQAVPTCLELAEHYADHSFEEPFPGRGQALLDYACKRYPSDRATVLANHPACAAAKGFKP